MLTLFSTMSLLDTSAANADVKPSSAFGDYKPNVRAGDVPDGSITIYSILFASADDVQVSMKLAVQPVDAYDISEKMTKISKLPLIRSRI